MKAALSVLALVLSPLAHADETSKFVCQQTHLEAGQSRHTMVLKEIGAAPIKEGVEAKCQFLLFNDTDRAPEIATVVSVTTEDVMFNFESKKHGISGIIFLDEYDQTSATINGVDMRFTCK